LKPKATPQRAKLEASVGADGGEAKTLWFYNVADTAIKTLAEQS
jgi:hypothetical protein